jgi:hypothetical protein
MQLRRADIKAGAKPPLDRERGAADRCQRSSDQVVGKLAPVIVTGASSHGQSARVGLFDHRGCRWAQPWLAILSARRIAWLLHRALWPRPEVAPQTGREPERPAVAAPPG